MMNITIGIDYCNLHFMAKTAIAKGDLATAHRAITEMGDVMLDGLVTSDKVVDGILADLPTIK